MNPFPIAFAMMRRNRVTAILFTVIVALAVALGIAISAQERALRLGSARAADKFDLIVAAPGSQNDLLFSSVYLDPVAVELLPPTVTARLMAEPQADFVAPIGFGDEVDGAPVIGTVAPFVDHLSGGLADGRLFATMTEAVVGSLVPHDVGASLDVSHSHGGGDADEAADALDHDHDHHHDHDHDAHGHNHDEDHPPLTVVGRMHPTGTPWDRAIIVPIEYTWNAHGLGTGHAEGDTHIGAPFDPAALPGVPALVVKPADVAAAYGLRGAYRTPESTAFFPAEVLVNLYAVLGDAARIMGALTLAALTLVIAAIFVGIVAVLDLQRQRFVVLRALGATRGFILLTVWSYVCTMIFAGAAIGLGLGWAAAAGVSAAVAAQTGIAMPVGIGMAELRFIGALVGLGALGALIPALTIYRSPVIAALR